MKGTVLSLSILLFASCSYIGIKPYSQPAPVTIAIVGDIMAHQSQIDSVYNKKCKCWDFSEVFKEVAPMIERADLAIGNFETTLPGDPKQYTGYPQFGAPDSLAMAIKDIGFDVLSTANNHSCDKGKDGLIRTITVLEQLGIKHLGTYRTQEEYEKNRILKIQIGGLNLVFLNYTYGTNSPEIPEGTVVNLIVKEKIAEDIILAKKIKPDGIIVMYHFGTEYLREPDPFQKEMIDFSFESGADIVLGGHPHTIQKFGKKFLKDRFGDEKERFYIFSLGNFISSQNARYVDGGMILTLSLSKQNERLRINEIGYEPVWVYIDRTKPKASRFRLLPVRKYLKNDQAIKLPKAAYQRMIQFHKDLTELLCPPGPST